MSEKTLFPEAASLGTRKPKGRFFLGQVVRIKPTTNSAYAGAPGIIAGRVGYWEGTVQGYGLVLMDGNMFDYRDEELEPVEDWNVIQMVWSSFQNVLEFDDEMLCAGLDGYHTRLKI